MSLNRCEQFLFDYLQSHAEEGHYWRQKVLSTSKSFGGDRLAASVALDEDLWAYYSDRAKFSADFRGHPAPDLRRTSLRNLAEYLLRLHLPIPATRKPQVS